MLYIHINVEQFKLEALKAQAERNKKAETEFGKIEGQYDATTDFAVFGVGDKRGGGL